MAGESQKSYRSVLFCILSPLAISTFALELQQYPEILDYASPSLTPTSLPLVTAEEKLQPLCSHLLPPRGAAEGVPARPASPPWPCPAAEAPEHRPHWFRGEGAASAFDSSPPTRVSALDCVPKLGVPLRHP